MEVAVLIGVYLVRNVSLAVYSDGVTVGVSTITMPIVFSCRETHFQVSNVVRTGTVVTTENSELLITKGGGRHKQVR